MLLAPPMTATSTALAPMAAITTTPPPHVPSLNLPRIDRIDARLEEYRQKLSGGPRMHYNVADYMTFFRTPTSSLPVRPASAPASAATTPPNAPSSSSSEQNSPPNAHEVRQSRDYRNSSDEGVEKHRSASVGAVPGKGLPIISDQRRRDGQDMLNGSIKDGRLGNNNDKMTVKPRVIEKPPTPPMESILKEFEFLINLPAPIAPDLPPDPIASLPPLPPQPTPKPVSKETIAPAVRKSASSLPPPPSSSQSPVIPLPSASQRRKSITSSDSSCSESESSSGSGSSSSSGESSSESDGESQEDTPLDKRAVDKDGSLASKSKKRPRKLPVQTGGKTIQGKTVSKSTKDEGYAKKGLPTSKKPKTSAKMPKKADEAAGRAPRSLIVKLKIPPRPLPPPLPVEEPEPRPNKRKEGPAPAKPANRVKEPKERVDKEVAVTSDKMLSAKAMTKSLSQRRRERTTFDSDEEGEVSHDEKRARVERGAAKSKPAVTAAGKKAAMAKATVVAPSSPLITKDSKRKRADESGADLGTKRRRAIEEDGTEAKKENISSPGSGSTPPARGARDSNGAERTQKAKLFSRSSSLEREGQRREDERRVGGTKGMRENAAKNNSKLGVLEGRRGDEVKREKARRSPSPENERSSSPVARQRKGGEKERENKAAGDATRGGKEREKDKDKEKIPRRNSARSWSKDRGRSRSWSPRSPRRDRDRDRDRGRGRDGDRDRRDRDRDNRGRRRSRDRSWDKSRDRSKELEKGGRSGSREREKEKERERNGRQDRDKDKDSRKMDKEKDRVSPATSSSTDRRSSVSSGGARRGTEGENGSAKDDPQRKIVSISLGSKSAANEVSNQTSSADRLLNNNTTPPPQNPANLQDARSSSATATISVTPSVPVTPSRRLTLADFKKQRKSDQGTTSALTNGSNGHDTDSSVNTPKDMESPAPGNPRTPAPSTMPVGADLEQTGSQGQVRLNGSVGGSPPEVRVKKEGIRTLASNQGHTPIDKWRIDGVRYRELGDSYKHQADKTWQTSEDLASVQWMEALFSYMQSFYYGELSNEQSAVGAWNTLIPLLKFLKSKHRSLKQLALFGLCCKIESVVLFHIFSLKRISHKRRLTRILSQLKAVDATSAASESLEAQRAIIVHHLEEVSQSFEEFEQVGQRWSEGEAHLTHVVLRRDFPDTWQRCCIEGDVSAGQSFEDECGGGEHFEWPMTHYTTFPRLVAFGRCLLREHAERKNVPFVPIKDY